LPSTLRSLISRETQGAELGFLGTSYLNVLQLNEALVKLR
jgi:K+-transporting ATPase c subunit